MAANDVGGFDYNNLGKRVRGRGRVLLKYKPDARFFGWLAYTLSRTTRQDPPDFPTRLFQYDQTHILTVLGSYRLGRRLGVRRALPARLGHRSTRRSSRASSTPTPAPTPASAVLRSRSGSRCSTSSTCASTSTGASLDWTLRTYLDVQNVYNRSNPEGVTYNYNYSQSQVQGFLPIIPSLGIRGEF